MKETTKIILAIVGVFLGVSLLIAAGVYRDDIKKELTFEDMKN